VSPGAPFGRAIEVTGSSTVDTGAELGQSEYQGGTASHLWCVDEDLMMRVWRRLLADRAAVDQLLKDAELVKLRAAANNGLSIPADTNASYLAHALLQSSHNNPLFPLGAPQDRQSGDLVRIAGRIGSHRKTSESWAVRILTDDGSSHLTRFSANAFTHARPTIPRAEVVVLGLVEDAQRLETRGIALAVQRPLGTEQGSRVV
jgi:hypothetical protein